MKVLASAPLLALAAAFDSPHNLSPKTRTLAPISVWRSSGASGGEAGAPLPLKLKGAGAYAVLDFGKEVAGITTVKFGAVSFHAAAQLASVEKQTPLR